MNVRARVTVNLNETTTCEPQLAICRLKSGSNETHLSVVKTVESVGLLLINFALLVIFSIDCHCYYTAPKLQTCSGINGIMKL